MLCCVCQISPIQSLVGQTGRRWVLGVISQLEDGHFYLEDLTASVEINLSNAISFCTLTIIKYYCYYYFCVGGVATCKSSIILIFLGDKTTKGKKRKKKKSVQIRLASVN